MIFYLLYKTAYARFYLFRSPEVIYWCEMLEMCVRVCGGHTIYAFQLMRLRIYISSLLIPFFMNTTFHLRHEFDVPASCIFPQLPSTTHTRKFRFSTFLALLLNYIYIYIYMCIVRSNDKYNFINFNLIAFDRIYFSERKLR